LARILEHGEVELDNNLVENAIRPTALGKENWLFFGSAEAGQRSAVMYTLIANCRLHGVEPHAYLKDVLTRLPRTTNQAVAHLTPGRLESRPAASRATGRLKFLRCQANRSSYHALRLSVVDTSKAGYRWLSGLRVAEG